MKFVVLMATCVPALAWLGLLRLAEQSNVAENWLAADLVGALFVVGLVAGKLYTWLVLPTVLVLAVWRFTNS